MMLHSMCASRRALLLGLSCLALLVRGLATQSSAVQQQHGLRAAFIYVVESESLGKKQLLTKTPSLLISLYHLQRNFLDRYPYPVYLFHAPDVADRWDEWRDAFVPAGMEVIWLPLPRADITGTDKMPRADLSSTFWWREVFSVPEIQGMDYICRMDAENFLTEPLQEDIFTVMQMNNFRYGFRTLQNVPLEDVQDLKALMQEYRSRHSANKDDALRSAKLKGGSPQHVVDGSFEVVRVSFFAENPHIQKIISSSNLVELIKPGQWHDGTLRTYICKTFVPASQIHVFDFPFYHHGFFARNKKMLKPL